MLLLPSSSVGGGYSHGRNRGAAAQPGTDRMRHQYHHETLLAPFASLGRFGMIITGNLMGVKDATTSEDLRRREQRQTRRGARAAGARGADRGAYATFAREFAEAERLAAEEAEEAAAAAEATARAALLRPAALAEGEKRPGAQRSWRRGGRSLTSGTCRGGKRTRLVLDSSEGRGGASAAVDLAELEAAGRGRARCKRQKRRRCCKPRLETSGRTGRTWRARSGMPWRRPRRLRLYHRACAGAGRNRDACGG